MCNLLDEVHHQMQAALAIFLIRCISLSMVGFVLLVWLIVHISCHYQKPWGA